MDMCVRARHGLCPRRLTARIKCGFGLGAVRLFRGSVLAINAQHHSSAFQPVVRSASAAELGSTALLRRPARILVSSNPPEHLDKSLWLEVYRQGGPPLDTMSYLARSLRNDPDIVNAQLLCTRGDGRLF
jgi:hypothetical protein